MIFSSDSRKHGDIYFKEGSMKRFITNALVMGIVCSGIVAALGSRPAAAAEPANPPGALYVSYQNQDIIDVIDLATHKVLRTIKGIPMAHGLAFSPD
ncbi:MAG: hypothetical protein A3F68_03830 [Acidobacteria bacterium RIFCSPLOWO2_12_FULL_54_10]|nr:MAG: hypothetical protein A3F68_03830 [Acidobacteria bacterium RIFCSPLOWO2_12_FULL_54_10]